MKHNPWAAASTASKNGVFLLAAILPVFYIRFVPPEKILIGTGIVTIAIGMFVITKDEYSSNAIDMFLSILTFFLMAALCKQRPALMAAGVGLWTWRKAALLLFPKTERFSAFPFVALAQLTLGFCATAILILWTGRYDFKIAFSAAAVMAAVAVLADSRLSQKNHPPIAELAAALAALSLLGFDTANFIYLQNPRLALAVSFTAAVFAYKTGLLQKKVLWFFVACASVIFISLGWPGWIVYCVSLLICEAGWRSRKKNQRARQLRVFRKFAAHSFPAALLALLSTGWNAPFTFYFAFAGSLSAVSFHNLYCLTAYTPSGESSCHENASVTRQNFFRGVIGISVIAACAVSGKFIPLGGLYILLLAGISPLLVPVFRNVLAQPGRDALWLPSLLGASVAAVATKLL